MSYIIATETEVSVGMRALLAQDGHQVLDAQPTISELHFVGPFELHHDAVTYAKLHFDDRKWYVEWLTQQVAP